MADPPGEAFVVKGAVRETCARECLTSFCARGRAIIEAMRTFGGAVRFGGRFVSFCSVILREKKVIRWSAIWSSGRIVDRNPQKSDSR
jgi:hypothetical protein